MIILTIQEKKKKNIEIDLLIVKHYMNNLYMNGAPVDGWFFFKMIKWNVRAIVSISLILLNIVHMIRLLFH